MNLRHYLLKLDNFQSQAGDWSKTINQLKQKLWNCDLTPPASKDGFVAVRSVNRIILIVKLIYFHLLPRQHNHRCPTFRRNCRGSCGPL